ncbi:MULTISPECIES: hypothetical protein [unclassified Pseudofrankia]|uniref:hypothetical protein n=1 Tax=unclassified Pseudofrankia TaxID=2994372 RepID=UPI0008D8FFD4|nr:MULTISPECIES: hypothetical protein [unclassified Pseudofrankia]MDT3441427.1 hypothetical protein [Pseudofrankia sp. BMG5.37]OHV49076.1 hypothetical protein BCD48_13450 [Pseudofrankia sp. BMG5.36]
MLTEPFARTPCAAAGARARGPSGVGEPPGLADRGDEAAGLATALIMLLEGAHVLCRAAGTLEPFDEAARSATTLARACYAAP